MGTQPLGSAAPVIDAFACFSPWLAGRVQSRCAKLPAGASPSVPTEFQVIEFGVAVEVPPQGGGDQPRCAVADRPPVDPHHRHHDLLAEVTKASRAP